MRLLFAVCLAAGVPGRAIHAAETQAAEAKTPEQNEAAARALVADGNALFAEGKYLEAQKKYTDAQALCPALEPRFNRGLSLYRQERYADAKEAFADAAREPGTLENVLSHLGAGNAAFREAEAARVQSQAGPAPQAMGPQAQGAAEKPVDPMPLYHEAADWYAKALAERLALPEGTIPEKDAAAVKPVAPDALRGNLERAYRAIRQLEAERQQQPSNDKQDQGDQKKDDEKKDSGQNQSGNQQSGDGKSGESKDDSKPSDGQQEGGEKSGSQSAAQKNSGTESGKEPSPGKKPDDGKSDEQRKADAQSAEKDAGGQKKDKAADAARNASQGPKGDNAAAAQKGKPAAGPQEQPKDAQQAPGAQDSKDGTPEGAEAAEGDAGTTAQAAHLSPEELKQFFDQLHERMRQDQEMQRLQKTVTPDATVEKDW